MVVWPSQDSEETGPVRFVFVTKERMEWYAIQLHEVIEDDDTVVRVRNYFNYVAELWERKRFGPTEKRCILVKVVLL